MNKNSMYDLEEYIAEIYDQVETDTTDVELIKSYIGDDRSLKILEPFCGTGRISIPLLKDGHQITGMDNATGMLDRFNRKLLKENVSTDNMLLMEKDVLTSEWPCGFDLVLLGNNSFYELATLEEQAKCIEKAYKSLNANGLLFVENDHMEGDLAKSWQDLNVTSKSICGVSKDGTIVETTRKTIWFDVKNRLAKFERCAKLQKSNGEIIESSYIQQKHPVSKVEVEDMILKSGFKILNTYGNLNGDPYHDDSEKAIFWAIKE